MVDSTVHNNEQGIGGMCSCCCINSISDSYSNQLAKPSVRDKAVMSVANRI